MHHQQQEHHTRDQVQTDPSHSRLADRANGKFSHREQPQKQQERGTKCCHQWPGRHQNARALPHGESHQEHQVPQRHMPVAQHQKALENTGQSARAVSQIKAVQRMSRHGNVRREQPQYQGHDNRDAGYRQQDAPGIAAPRDPQAGQ